MAAAAEPLESRRLLSAGVSDAPGAPDAAWPAFAPPATAEPSGDVISLHWEGADARARRGRWLLRLEPEGETAKTRTGNLDERRRALERLLRTRRPRMRVVDLLDTANLAVIDAPPGLPHARLLRSFRSLPGFRYLEPDLLASPDATEPDDPRFAQMYQLHNAGQTGGTPGADIDAPAAWGATLPPDGSAPGGDPVVVGVLDSGILYTHPDLAPSMWRNPFETAADGIDNDGNGFVDDVFGADFWANDGDPIDESGHGTHVAGTIAAAAGNGISGVAPHAKLMALRISDESNLTLSGAVRALDYAIAMRRRGVNLRVINGSWSGGTPSNALRDALEAAGNEGILYVCSAGNNGADNDEDASFPSNYRLPSVVSVAATDQHDVRTPWSNVGRTTVHLAAPGALVVSTVSTDPSWSLSHPTGYRRASGTSMSAPHVAGVAALAWAARPGATVAQVKQALLDGADPLPTLAGRTISGGRLNAFGTLRHLGLFMAEPSAPGEGAVVDAPPVSFTLRFADPVDATTVQPSDFAVRPVGAAATPWSAATTVALAPDGHEVTLGFSGSPVTAGGAYDAAMGRGAVARDQNRDGRVDVLDLLIVQRSRRRSLSLITAPPAA